MSVLSRLKTWSISSLSVLGLSVLLAAPTITERRRGLSRASLAS
jgi:hypothetical protein